MPTAIQVIQPQGKLPALMRSRQRHDVQRDVRRAHAMPRQQPIRGLIEESEGTGTATSEQDRERCSRLPKQATEQQQRRLPYAWSYGQRKHAAPDGEGDQTTGLQGLSIQE